MPESDSNHAEEAMLASYFSGQCPAAESARIAAWIAADPARQRRVEALHAKWSASGFLLDAARVETLWRRLENDLPAVEPIAARSTTITLNTVRRTTAWRVAAAVMLVAGAAGLWRWGRRAGVAPSGSLATTTASRMLDAPRGRRVHARLPDGTDVTLGPASTLRYVVAADRGPRDVWLDGTGYFVVTHDAARPFTVRTARGIVADLGTRFVVRAYAADSVMRVAVAEGKVSLKSMTNADSLVLAQSDRGRATEGGRLTAERKVAIDRDLAWTKGQLDFEDTPLADAVADIGRWYDLDVQLADSGLGRRELSASFRAESVEDVLRAISASAGVDVERRGRVVMLRAHRR